MNVNPSIKPASDRSILIQFGSKISEETHQMVVCYTEILLESFNRYIKTISPAYCTILIRLNNDIMINETISELKSLLKQPIKLNKTTPQTIKIPVCYEQEFAPDMDKVMKHTGYSNDEIIEKHSSGEYLVYFIGFSPGFPYIGGMDHTLTTPRLTTPRKIVPTGSVAIGGSQTGIYPLQSPGGWNIIGRTHLTLFQTENINNSLIKIGNKIQFYPITKDEFLLSQNSI